MILQKIKNMSSLFLTYHIVSLTITVNHIATSPQQKKSKKNSIQVYLADKKIPGSKSWDFCGTSPGNSKAQIPFPARPIKRPYLPYFGFNRGFE
jgi:hypothetical protein